MQYTLMQPGSTCSCFFPGRSPRKMGSEKRAHMNSMRRSAASCWQGHSKCRCLAGGRGLIGGRQTMLCTRKASVKMQTLSSSGRNSVLFCAAQAYVHEALFEFVRGCTWNLTTPQ